MDIRHKFHNIVIDMDHTFSHILLNWYQQNKRDLPWRQTTDPYKIWLSEIILQQTRVMQGMPYYQVFVEIFPDVKSLANADEQEVLKLWQGLGYYSRARNLHITAKFIANELNGKFPDNYHDLIKLKGIGDYTAAAIASFCFNEAVATVDGNVFRVLARYFGIQTPINEPKAKKEFKELANTLIEKGNPGMFNQAMMEFGALQCVPSSPDCENCPLNHSCEAYRLKKVQDYPVKLNKTKVRKRFFNYLVLQDQQNQTVIEKRMHQDIWKHLYQFPLIESEKELDFKEIIPQIASKMLFLNDSQSRISLYNSIPIKHKLSHQEIFLKFWVINVENIPQSTCSWQEVSQFPFPIIIHYFIESFIKDL